MASSKWSTPLKTILRSTARRSGWGPMICPIPDWQCTVPSASSTRPHSKRSETKATCSRTAATCPSWANEAIKRAIFPPRARILFKERLHKTKIPRQPKAINRNLSKSHCPSTPRIPWKLLAVTSSCSKFKGAAIISMWAWISVAKRRFSPWRGSSLDKIWRRSIRCCCRALILLGLWRISIIGVTRWKIHLMPR